MLVQDDEIGHIVCATGVCKLLHDIVSAVYSM